AAWYARTCDDPDCAALSTPPLTAPVGQLRHIAEGSVRLGFRRFNCGGELACPLGSSCVGGAGGLWPPSRHATTAHADMLQADFCRASRLADSRSGASYLLRRVRNGGDRPDDDRSGHGSPRGWGLVEMPNGAEAQAAMAGLNGTSCGGRPLTVHEARQREARGEPRRPRW